MINKYGNATNFVYSTNDYSIFKHLDGNREITVRRKARIKESIATVGYVMNPIVVNENLEVIDGQGRLEAFKDLGLPVYYVVAEGAGIDECRQLNLGQSNWTTLDFARSYADYGNVNYERLMDIIDDYGKGLNSDDSIFGMVGNHIITTGGGDRSRIRCGELMLSASDAAEVRKAIEYIKKHLNGINRIDGAKRVKYSAICWVIRNTDIDKKRLGMVLDKKCMEFDPIAESCIDRFLKNLSDIYNWHLQPDNCIYLAEEYDKFTRRRK